MTRGDEVIKEIAQEMGREEHFHPTEVAVFFGKPGDTVSDPYFDGEGPDRVGCTFCGACMTGCRVGAKNTLDRNYLYLAEKHGAEVLPETEVTHVAPRDGGGYRVQTKASFGKPHRQEFTAERMIFSGGVMGTIPLLLQMKERTDGLPKLSDRLGDFVRSNSEALFGVIAPGKGVDFTKGVAITSILHTDDHSHIEPVRYGPGSGFFRTLMLPHAPGPNALARMWGVLVAFARHPLRWMKAFFVKDSSKHTQILLYMRTLEGALRMKLGRSLHTGFRRGLVTEVDDPSQAPSAFIKEATDLAESFADKVDGVTSTVVTETLLGVPSTAHILGGACMGASAETGVIDPQPRGLQLPRHVRHRRVGHLRKPGRQSFAHDHGPRRTCDEPHRRQARQASGQPRRKRDCSLYGGVKSWVRSEGGSASGTGSSGGSRLNVSTTSAPRSSQ